LRESYHLVINAEVGQTGSYETITVFQIETNEENVDDQQKSEE
jgi:hypothetical protein